MSILMQLFRGLLCSLFLQVTGKQKNLLQHRSILKLLFCLFLSEKIKRNTATYRYHTWKIMCKNWIF